MSECVCVCVCVCVSVSVCACVRACVWRGGYLSYTDDVTIVLITTETVYAYFITELACM